MSHDPRQNLTEVQPQFLHQRMNQVQNSFINSITFPSKSVQSESHKRQAPNYCFYCCKHSLFFVYNQALTTLLVWKSGPVEFITE